MRDRCRNPNNKYYADYGGRGIRVDPAFDSFPAFLSHVGARPSRKHSIDRIDNNGHYAPGNVRWATPAEQARNTRVVRLYNLDGQIVSQSELARMAGANPGSVSERASRGYTAEQIVEWAKARIAAGPRPGRMDRRPNGTHPRYQQQRIRRLAKRQGSLVALPSA